jgi:hypothetical protein
MYFRWSLSLSKSIIRFPLSAHHCDRGCWDAPLCVGGRGRRVSAVCTIARRRRVHQDLFDELVADND